MLMMFLGFELNIKISSTNIKINFQIIDLNTWSVGLKKLQIH